MTTLAPTFPTTAKDYKFERVFYEARLELKGKDKYSTYVKHIGCLFENIQLVDPLAIMHVVDENRGDSLLDWSQKWVPIWLCFYRMRR